MICTSLRLLIFFALPIWLAGWIGAADAQSPQPSPTDASSDYPRKPIRFLIPSAPGGGTDVIGRLVAQKVSEAWNRPLVVENRGGGGTTIGTNIVAKSAPDGYTMLMTAGNFAMIPALRRKLPYDPEKDFIPVMLVATQATLLAVNSSVPVRSVTELIAFARSKPGEIRYSSGGNGTPAHMSTELFRVMAKISLAHISYNGTGPALNAVVGGEVHMLMGTAASLLPHVRSGRLRALAVTGSARAKAVPELPTIAEAGLPGYMHQSWYGLWVPANTPPAIVRKINEEFNRALVAPVVLERFAGPAIEPLGGTPKSFAAFLTAEIRKWTKLVREAGIQAD
ncbi:MAG: tripartite tricarboxylate transporter substrate binding protein [Betaproteobacteria bacterium]|nr:tripartite tricarboxylate transporter substrate binding protein [Betaproteobacteria bacterium]